MVRHNNCIPNGHFHKSWQRFVRVNFNQPMKKVRRERYREIKARRRCPRPVDLLRPVVRCPTVRYHTKSRFGRGFSLTELKIAEVNRKYAKSVGISVDPRRRNKSYESILENLQRIKVFFSKLVIFPTNPAVGKYVTKGLNTTAKPTKIVKAHQVTAEDLKRSCYQILRQARTAQKKLSRKIKRERSKNVDPLDVKKFS